MLRVLCLFVAIGYGAAIVCRPDTCALMDCGFSPITVDTCNGVIKPNGGLCGCCDMCVQQLAEGDKCAQTLFLGIPPSVECATGLYCNAKSGVCEQSLLGSKRATGPCTAKYEEVKQWYATHPGFTGLEYPNCDDQGNFKPIQNSGSMAFCVTTNGTTISNYMVHRWETQNMNCQCARDEYAYQQTGLIGKTFSCEMNGNYAAIGCTGSVCYCQDQFGKQVGTSTVSIGMQDSLNC